MVRWLDSEWSAPEYWGLAMSSSERQFSITMPLSVQMYKWGPVIIILWVGAITNISYGGYETLGLVTTFLYHPQQAYWSDQTVVLRIIASYYGILSKPAILQLGCQENFRFVSAPGKLKYCIYPVIKAKPLLPCPIFGIQYTDFVCLPPCKCASPEGNKGIEKEKVF